MIQSFDPLMPLAEARQEGYIHQRFVHYLRKGGEQGKKPKMGCGVVRHAATFGSCSILTAG